MIYVPHLDDRSCHRPDQTTEEQAVKIEAVLSKAVKMEKSSAGRETQAKTLPARIRSPRSSSSPRCTK